MKKNILTVFLFFVISCIYAQNDTIGEVVIYNSNNNYYLLTENDTVLMDTSSVILRFKSNIDESGKEAFSQQYNLSFIGETSGDWFHYKLPFGSIFTSICDSIYNDNRIYELCYNVMIDFCGFEPDDPDFSWQWYLDRIDAPEAWNITFGDKDIVVAVIDEGLFLEHDDIGYDDDSYENVFHNEGEDEWNIWYDPDMGNDFDDDNNSKIDDWKGWNFANFVFDPPIPAEFIEDNNVIPEKDWAYHGTAICGIISAKTNNNNDMSGIAGGNNEENIEGVKVLPIKVSDYKWDSQLNEWVVWQNSGKLAFAIDYAVEMGANIITLSIKIADVPQVTEPLDAAFQNAYNNNVFITAAVGNKGYENTIPYPARNQYTMAVGASDQDDEDWELSNNGPELEIVAPGTDILSLDNESTVTNLYGTSFSAPMVAATAALMLSVKPDLTNEQIREILKNTAEKVGSHSYNSGWNKYMGYGRLNTYYAVCEVLELLPAYTIQLGAVWYNPVFTLHDITIEPGATLDIHSTVFLGNDAKIIVKPGATLILDGATLTNYKFCGHGDNLWKGVEVWGDKNYSQFYCNGQHQGKIILKNGAKIENAEIGVLLGKQENGNFLTDYAGGIIQISDDGNKNTRSAYFINNKYSVRFYNYYNFKPAPDDCTESIADVDNLSFIKDTKFELNQDYYENNWYKACIYMSEVNGIKIAGCEFVNNFNELHGHGINAYNAGFKVYSLCNSQVVPCPIGDENECTFDNFKKGINLGNFNSTNTIDVENAVFTNNSIGINLSNVQNASVLFSYFYIGEYLAEEGECEGEGSSVSAYGINMDECSGFAIEENNFTKYSGAPQGNFIGIRVKDCPSVSDDIYLNKFIGLSIGNIAEGINRSEPDMDKTGVSYICNKNYTNHYDYYVAESSKIRGKVGTPTNPSGNILTEPEQSQVQFQNDGENEDINYFYDNSIINSNQWLVKHSDNVFASPITAENTCLSHYSGGGTGTDRGIVLTPEQKQEMELLYFQNTADYISVEVLYSNLKDGGNTEALKTEVETAWPSDMWELRAELLGKSPHLSLEVLKKAADKTDVLPESVLFEILTANPDELRKEELISYLENKEQPLPDYMIDILKQLASGITYKTILQGQMSDYYHKKVFASQNIVRSILNDTVIDLNELRNWIDNIGGLVADKQIISTYLQENNYNSAQSLLNMLPTLYNLTGYDLFAYNDYKTITELQISLTQQGRTIYEIEPEEVNVLMDLADNGYGSAKVSARVILELVYGSKYYDCPHLPESIGLKSGVTNYNILTKSTGIEITVKPNPADNWVAFNYKLPSKSSSAIITISNAEGKIITKMKISGGVGQKIWDIRSIEPGVYLYSLVAGGIRKHGKLVIK